MPVVIKEFEAVTEAAPAPGDGGASDAGGDKPVKPHDLARLSARIARRKARIWAH